MKGLALSDLAAEVERQAKTKRDFVAPASRIKLVERKETDDINRLGWTQLRMQGKRDPFDIGPIFHEQIGEHLKIPRKYYSRMLDNAPVLLRRNVNHWLSQDQSNRMIRTLDGKARAFLSDKYRVRDNYDLCLHILPLFSEYGLEVISANVTDRRLYLKAVHPNLRGEIRGKKVGDIVQGGVEVGNSETGFGTSFSRQFMLRLSCTNGMTFSETGLKKHHLGSRMGLSADKAQEVFRSETQEAEDKAFFMMMQDVTRDCLQEKAFHELLDRCNDAAGDNELSSKKGRKIEDVIEVTRKSFGLTEGEGESVMKHLIEGGDLSRWGMANAVTRAAQDVESYDRFSDLQRVGGQIIELPRKRWAEIALRN
jgi:hypothetical protein